MTANAEPTKTIQQVEEEAARKAQGGSLLSFEELENAQDVEYVVVPTDEWKKGSYLRFASTDAGTSLRYAKAIKDDTGGGDAMLRLVIACMVDDEGNRRVTDEETVVKLLEVFKKRTTKVVDRCLEAVMTLNGIKVPSPTPAVAAAEAKKAEETKNGSGEVATSTSPTESPAAAA